MATVGPTATGALDFAVVAADGDQHARVLSAPTSRLRLVRQFRRRAKIRRLPWDGTYVKRRDAFIQSALGRFTGTLPPGYGVGMDERVVEIPWVHAELGPGPGRVLDAGSALNRRWLLKRFDGWKIDVLTLAPEHESSWQLGISYLFDDMRALPFRDGLYDAIVCVSTIEHIGMDNTEYGGDSEYRPQDALAAMRELARVLRPGGRLLFTAPFGRYAEMGSARQLDGPAVQDLVDAFAPSATKLAFYRYRETGWELSDATGCGDARYTHWLAPGRIRIDDDLAAGARAVVCATLLL
jgi:SAM-dependent methyltransferase